MKKVIAHIELLLNEHDCVVVPRLGAFLAQTREAQFLATGEILPPMREYTFNAELNSDDSRLVSSIASLEEITLEKADALLFEKVEELFWALTLEQEVDFGAIGSLRLADGKLSFTPHIKRQNLSALAFAPCTLTALPAVASIVAEEQCPTVAETPERIHLTIRKKSLRFVSTVAAAILFFLFFSTPVTDQSRHAHYATLLSADLFVKPAPTLYPIDTVSLADSELHTPLHESDSDIIEEIVASKEATPYYYLIVSSLPDRTPLTNEVSLLQSAGHHEAGALQRGSRTRIYLKSYPKEDREEAQRELNHIRNEASFAQAWLYASK